MTGWFKELVAEVLQPADATAGFPEGAFHSQGLYGQPCQVAAIGCVAVEWCGAGVSPPAGEWRYGRPAAKALPIIDP